MAMAAKIEPHHLIDSVYGTNSVRTSGSVAFKIFTFHQLPLRCAVLWGEGFELSSAHRQQCLLHSEPTPPSRSARGVAHRARCGRVLIGGRESFSSPFLCVFFFFGSLARVSVAADASSIVNAKLTAVMRGGLSEVKCPVTHRTATENYTPSPLLKGSHAVASWDGWEAPALTSEKVNN